MSELTPLAQAYADLKAKDVEIAKAKEDRAAYERWTAEIKDVVDALRAEIAKLAAALEECGDIAAWHLSGVPLPTSDNVDASFERIAKLTAREQSVTT